MPNVSENKANLKAQAANNTAFAEHHHILQEITGRLERAVELVEHRVTAHSDPAILLSLPPDEEERLTQLRRLQPCNEDGSSEPEAHDHRFLGLSAQQWLTMPEEILAIFGLVDVVAEWRRQAGERSIPKTSPPEDTGTEQPCTQYTPGKETTSESPSAGTDYDSVHDAFRFWLEKFCPHEPRKSERAEWIAQRKFSHDGTMWSASWYVRFSSDDGRVFERPPYRQKENRVRSPHALSD
jgi:hypothetical protein